MISRREFLAFTGAAILCPSTSWAEDRLPSSLDHVILGCSRLDRGIAFVEERTGVRAALGGVHPDRGTMNALVSLGERHYLEIMAPNPDAKVVQSSDAQLLKSLRDLASPRLVTWAVHSGDIDAFAKTLREAGIAIEGPFPGSRVRPDGRVLKWKTLSLADDRDGLLPFFIEWDADTVHPSVDAPAGCHIERFTVAAKDAGELSGTFQHMGLDVLVEPSEVPQLRLRISGPKGTFDLTS